MDGMDGMDGIIIMDGAYDEISENAVLTLIGAAAVCWAST